MYNEALHNKGFFCYITPQLFYFFTHFIYLWNYASLVFFKI
ncbi:hypothetical protein SAMN05661044_04857 [Olivibacter domesticus]|uniref:Uncharacterized protein n=1 Tax=Olivibacter domesticus TaxID=407022 RepID=A0A1H7XEH0_OLID1|nr:hypothetical protein SAMN05661044_04857 [Olivibacter domesticus]